MGSHRRPGHPGWQGSREEVGDRERQWPTHGHSGEGDGDGDPDPRFLPVEGHRRREAGPCAAARCPARPLHRLVRAGGPGASPRLHPAGRRLRPADARGQGLVRRADRPRERRRGRAAPVGSRPRPHRDAQAPDPAGARIPLRDDGRAEPARACHPAPSGGRASGQALLPLRLRRAADEHHPRPARRGGAGTAVPARPRALPGRAGGAGERRRPRGHPTAQAALRRTPSPSTR